MNILIAGDYVAIGRIAGMIEKEDFSFFDEIKPLISQSDLSIVNLEAPIVSKNQKPILKHGPNLKTTPKVINSLNYAGFNLVTLANNHIMDYGEEGLEETIINLKNGGIDFVGVGRNLKEATKIKYFEKDGKKLAIINCCEHEFSIAEENKAGANPINVINQFKAIQEARKNADFVLIITHGGHEMWQFPSPRMVETYRFFVETGADAVINHHQHCYSGYEVYNGKPIFYGLGNFCFDRPNKVDKWYEGYLVTLNLEDNVKFKIHPYIQCKENMEIKLLPQNAFDKNLNEFNQIIKDAGRLKSINIDFYKKSEKGLNFLLQPYKGRLLSKLFSLGLLPKLYGKRKKIILQNFIFCESHRDKLDYYFKNFLNEENS